ncbi:MAG: pectinesterase family protein [Prolixibacteraceae bacterium]|jgi:pectinesterase|nr:pectinesterase family protein [Prolixibacteraceae bacterium]
MKWVFNIIVVVLLFVAFTGCESNSNKFIVAADGSGNYKTIQSAIDAAIVHDDVTAVIYIKSGVYNEKVLIPKGKDNLHLLGEGAERTIITWDDFAGKDDITTATSFTLKVDANDIKLEKLTVENSEGLRGQAIALYMNGDRCLVTNCNIKGNQDALCAHGDFYRQYYRDCKIEGTTNFIMGSATALFERCEILCKKHSFITSASTPKQARFGYVFKDCEIKAAPGITKVYLGRPWRDYANVVYMNCNLGIHIRPEGWHNWDTPEREETAYYAEYKNYGPGANPKSRVKWSHQLSDNEAWHYSVETILNYSEWKHK